MGAARSVKAVMFDLDGTLLDSLEDLADSMNTVLTEKGWPPHPVDAYRYFVGDGAATLIHRVLPADHRTPAVEAECLSLFRAAYATRWNIKTRPYQGIPEMLAALAARKTRMAVLSNKPHDATEQCVRELLRETRFDAVQGQRATIPKKPAPDGAVIVARTLGVEPGEILYLGDTATDMQTAVGAGMIPIGALWGFRSAGELLEHGARRVLGHPQELLPLLDDRTFFA